MAKKKFIPDSDHEFAMMARSFALAISDNPDHYFLSTDEAAEITQAVKAFRDSLAIATRPWSRTKSAIGQKEQARKDAERIIRSCANRVRANDAISPVHKNALQVRERPKRLKKRTCPQQAPHLRFVGTEDAGHSGLGGVHVIAFRPERESFGTRAKPEGAVRLELFFEFVKPGQPVPMRPDELSGWPRYVRSFTTTPMRVKHPVPAASAGPMLIVYWARWADAKGETGPWSRTLVTRMEGELPVAGLEQATVACDDQTPALKPAA